MMDTRALAAPTRDDEVVAPCSVSLRLLVIRPPITPQLHQLVLPSPPPQPSNRCILLHPALTVAPGSGIDARVDFLIWRRRAGCFSHRTRRLGEGRPMVGDPRQGGISEAAGWRDSGSMDSTLRAHVGQILTVASRGFLPAPGGKTSPIV